MLFNLLIIYLLYKLVGIFMPIEYTKTDKGEQDNA